METKFNTLPPLKRFRLMQQQEEEEKHNTDPDFSNSFILPSKKRKEARDLNPSQLTPTVYLPAKKRIWAVHPQFDLNLEYISPLESHQKTNTPINDNNNNDKTDDFDDGVVCAVCDSTDGDPSDPIVFCDGCDLMVHSSCYGSPLIESVPEGDWFCAPCLFNNKGGTLFCSLCPNLGGAMKPTEDGKWAHIVCSLLVPEVFFVDSKRREGIDCSKVPKRRYEKKCYVCESLNGCAIDCSEPNCELSFHVSCGFGEDLCIEYRDGGKKKGGVVAAFCKEHTQLWEKQQQSGKFKIVARDEGKK